MTTEEEEILKQTVLEEDSGEQEEDTGVSLGSLAERIRAEKKKKRRKRIKRTALIAFLLFFSYAIYFLFKPFEQSLDYGICKTLLELHVAYPQTIYISEVQKLRSGTMRIWFTRIDPFGDYRMSPFECTFAIDPETKVKTLAKLRLDKVEVSPEIVKRYNYAIPYIAQNPPDLILPGKLPDDILILRADVDKMRRVVVK